MLIHKRTGMTGAELTNNLLHVGGLDEDNKVRTAQIEMYRADFPHSKATDDMIISIILRSMTGRCTCDGTEHPQHYQRFGSSFGAL